MTVAAEKIKDLTKRWTELEGKKKSFTYLCEEYANWTLPYMFPTETSNQNTEMQLSPDSIGAQGVNNLSNKVVSTLFPAQTTFFRLRLDAETRKLLQQAVQASGSANVDAAKDAMAKMSVEVDEQLAEAEKTAMEYMDMVAYRPQAVMAAKLLIITGNALMYHPDKKPVQTYNLRNYCIVRDLSGEVIEIMTKECKAFETFHPDVQAKLRNGTTPGYGQTYNDDTSVSIYTQIKLEDDGKFHIYQCGDHVYLTTTDVFYPKDELPWIPLTWNLIQGEDYGRGLVGDYAGAFHAVNVLSTSLLNIVAVMGDIKFLVNPASHVDIDGLNKGQPGSYHAGKEGDVTVIETNKLQDAQFIQAMIERYEKQISQAFLLLSQLTRNAERVTAEEIKQNANELETSNGGIYSALALKWQVPTANIVLKQSGFQGLNDGITPKIVTGMDSLSRAAELDNLRLFFMDLQMLNTVPEDVRAGIDVPGLMKVLGTARSVEYKQFTKTAEQMQADQQALQDQQKALQDNQAQGELAKETGKAVANEGNSA